MNMPFFSIIIPVYNVEKYLKQCIESVSLQDFRDFEIILVDDGSPDNCPALCDEYAGKYDFIRVIHKMNGGLSDARNVGLDAASGKYILFIDSDDFWDDSHALSDMYEKLRFTDADVLIFGMRKYYQNDNVFSEKRIPTCNNVNSLSYSETIIELQRTNSFAASACDKAMKRSFIEHNQMRFVKGQLSEDIEWCAKILLAKPYIVILSKCIYVYRQQNSISISSNIGLKNITDISDVIKKYTAIAQKQEQQNVTLLNFMAEQYVLWMYITNLVETRLISYLLEDMKGLFFLLNYTVYPHVYKIARAKYAGFYAIRKMLSLKNKFTPPVITIIIPVYNTEKYLRKCLDSLLAQTYTNIEIVLVDDGSTDSSGKICDEYAEKYSHIKVIHKKNGGLSSARKAGAENAIGEFITIVDSDDWIEPDMIARMVATKLEKDVDLVICSYCREYENNSFPVHIFDGDKTFWGKEYQDKIYRRLYGPVDDEMKSPEKLDSLGSVCMKLYPKEIIKEADFIPTSEVGSAEDVLLNISILNKLNSAAYIDRPYYHYRKNSESSTSVYRSNLYYQWEVLYGYMEKYLNRISENELYQKALNNRIAIGTLGLGLNEISAKHSIFKCSKNIKQILSSERYQNAFCKLDITFFPLKWKIFFLLEKYKLSFLLVMMLQAISFLRKRFAQ